MIEVILAVYFEKDVHFLKNINTYLLLVGFDKAQAETIVSALTILSNVSLDTIYKEMVTQAQQVIFSFLSLLTVSLGNLFHNCISVYPPTF